MKSEDAAADTIIVGGGFSGTMLAAELARRDISSALVEGGGRAGRGTAFSTPEDVHLLNVVAGRMGAWADEPDHFAKAVESEDHAADDFVPRRRYGEYIRRILDEAISSGLVRVVSGEAAAVGQAGWGSRVMLADGSQIDGKALALAQGNQPPEPHAFAEGIRLIGTSMIRGATTAAERSSGSRLAAGMC